MTYKEIIKKVSDDTEISQDVVDKAYKAFWLYIKNSIQSLPLKGDLNEDQFHNLNTNFNVPSIGKLTCTYGRYRGVKEKFDYIKKLRKNERNKKD